MTPEQGWQAVWWDRCDDAPAMMLGNCDRPEYARAWPRFYAAGCADAVRWAAPGRGDDLARRVEELADDPDPGGREFVQTDSLAEAIESLLDDRTRGLGRWAVGFCYGFDPGAAVERAEYFLLYLREHLGPADPPRRCELVRCLFANPFRPPVRFDPEWRTATTVALARTMYDAREFDPMPVLADALQDAGCEDEHVLGHCRGPGPHARGCWVIDRLLGLS